MSYQFNNPAFLGSLGGGVGETDPGAVQNHYAFADTANIHVDEEAHTNLATSGSPTVSSGVAVFGSGADYLSASNLLTGAFTITCKARIDGAWPLPFGFALFFVTGTTEHVSASLITGDPGKMVVRLTTADDDGGGVKIRELRNDIDLDKSTLAFVGISFAPDSKIIFQINDQQGLITDFVPNNSGVWSGFQIGPSSSGAGETGQMDDMRLWNHALAADELNYVYQNL